MIRIAIVEDNRKYRDHLRRRLQACRPLDLTLICENGRDFVQRTKEMDPARRPEVVLMDINMSEMDGISATAQAKAAFPEMQFLMLTFFAGEEDLFRAVQAGASGYLLKEETVESICKAILEVYQGYGAMSPLMARKALDLLRRKVLYEPDQKLGAHLKTLTKRELEILELVFKGYTYRKIAEDVSISEETVKKHVRNIYTKLQVHNKIAAIKMAVEKNWFKE